MFIWLERLYESVGNTLPVGSGEPTCLLMTSALVIAAVQRAANFRRHLSSLQPAVAELAFLMNRSRDVQPSHDGDQCGSLQS